MSLRTRVRLAVAALIAVALAAAGPASVQAAGSARGDHHHHGDDRITVMTHNLYLGSSLDPALAATTPAEFVGAVATIYGTMLFTNFPRRAEAIADTIAAERPDLVGLQEVSNWIARTSVAGATPPPSFDFLKILQAALAKRGLDYKVAVVSQNADIGPAPLVAPTLGCPVPTATTPPKCDVRLQDRDVILVNDDTHGLKVRKTRTGDYVAQQEFTPPGSVPVSFARGWAYVDATYRGTDFRFTTTHLEVEQFAKVQEAQAAEFLAGPARARGPVIATGDFNSAADPATTTEPTATYSLLTKSWFKDAWAVNDGDPGLTCCQNGTLTNPVSQLRTRIDLVLTHGDVRAKSAHVVDDQPIGTSPPFWASDHAGLVATLRLDDHHDGGH